MKKIVLPVLSTVFALSLVTNNNVLASADTNHVPKIQSIGAESLTVNGARAFSLAGVNKIAHELGEEEFTLDQIPTVEEINEALSKIKVSQDNPSQTIDLGNGFAVTTSVSLEPATNGVNSISPAGKDTLAVTAQGEWAITLFKVFRMYAINISENYTYDKKTNKIIDYQKKPSAQATGQLGWVGEITDKGVERLDDTAMDAWADANYTYIKALGNYSGHIELRFTGTGTYYVHDQYIK
ncbi:hypothetical protein [Brevibacillus laterosporus]|uniref:hypothetical protein n=1 Tax=Brevibacillus laterosporus TaxID=1465 RepID=UPI0018CECB05|nr:hypothetical protein [Brevibacillus laterosporus]MED1909520.1 hypothetical protein [Brevibacillus laterosporus]